MKAAVTGANGFIGKHLVKQLVEDGYEVVGVIRDKQKASVVKELGANVKIADITKSDQIANAIKDSDLVFHLAAKVRLHKYESVKPTMVDGTKNVIDACKQRSIALAYASSIAVYGDAKGSVVDENMILKPDTGYGVAKYEAEKIVLYAVNDGLRAVILRPGYVYGYGDTISRMLQMGRAAWIGDGTNYSGFIHVEDCVRAFVACLTKGKSGEAYNAVDNEPATWLDYLKYACKLLNIDGPKLYSIGTVKIASYLYYGFSRAFGKMPDFTPEVIRAMQYSCKYSNRKIREQVNFTFRYPTYREGLEQVVNFIKAAQN